jgi:hypothetical protein
MILPRQHLHSGLRQYSQGTTATLWDLCGKGRVILMQASWFVSFPDQMNQTNEINERNQIDQLTQIPATCQTMVPDNFLLFYTDLFGISQTEITGSVSGNL